MFSIHGGRGNLQLSCSQFRLVNWGRRASTSLQAGSPGLESFVPLGPCARVLGYAGSTLRGWISRLNFAVRSFRIIEESVAAKPRNLAVALAGEAARNSLGTKRAKEENPYLKETETAERVLPAWHCRQRG
jgi:hypothetical protein